MRDEELEKRLRSLFLEELQDGLTVLREGLARLEEQDVPDLPDLQRELFRVSHSLKGAAHSANVPTAVDICHRLEESFARAQSGERALDAGLVSAMLDDTAALSAVARSMGGESAAPADADAAPAVAVRPVSRLRVAVSSAEELVARVTDLVDVLARTGVTDRAVQQAVTQLVAASHELRLQPFTDVCVGLEEAAADVARASGKQVRLLVEGGQTQVDRAVSEGLREPLLHLVRNAVDHGIEPPSTRLAAGKSPQGTLRVAAAVVEGTVEVSVEDDGAGVDGPALRMAAGERQVHVDDALELAFTPGLSTASRLTTVSGRGMGLDAVRDRVERLGGSARLVSTMGVGATVILTVPATLATLRVMLVRAGGEVFGLPLGQVERVQEVPRADLRDAGDRQVLLGTGEPTPVFALAAAIGMDTSEAALPARASLVRVIASAGGGALEVDAVEGEVDGVLRPLPSRLLGLPGVLGLLGLRGGALVPVLNPATCVRWGLARSRRPSAPVLDAEPRRTVLLAEDTLTTRVLEQSILETAGYDVVAAVDGAQAWRLLQDHAVDIVVSDVDMPNMGGVDLCRAIRRSDRFADLPVVLVTSLGSDDDRRRGVDAGADAYLVKSAFDRQTLLDTLERLL